MFAKLISCLLIALMISVSVVNTAFATTSGHKNSEKKEAKLKKRTAEIKAAVAKLGSGKDSKVKVKLRDKKKKVKGYISEFDEDTFTVVDKKGDASIIEYRNAKQIKGNNLHAGVWVAIGVGATLLTLYLIWASQDW